ncbi:hypothetical protein MMC14_008671 [Varicellaria rhodocarpa]|nr:hypothetical protein [Varicellaria rhodocarpa]
MKSEGLLPVRVLTHNIRYATKSPFKGEELWSIRKPRLISELYFNTNNIPETFICLQEVLHEQLNDVLSGLNEKSEEWAYIGKGRDDGSEAGEYSPIIYKPSIWKLLEQKIIWLSETPHRPSKGWDAASIRILTIGRFQHCQSGKKMVAMNTHLDDQGSISRLEAAKMIASQVFSMSDSSPDGEETPCFLAGDLNSEPNMEAYQFLTLCSPMTDVESLIPATAQYGNKNTFTGFEGLSLTRIDFIFIKMANMFTQIDDGEPIRDDIGSRNCSVDAGLYARGYGVLENRFDDGVNISDHRAVVADLFMK